MSRSAPEIFEQYAKWLRIDSMRDELLSLIPDEVQDKIRDRFYQDLAFGTGGLRGVMAAGANRMNEPVVVMATQGLANYVKSQTKKGRRPGAVVCFDARHNSRRFAEATAEVLAGNGFVVHLFKQLRSTPEVSFAIAEVGAAVGVMITASHNPPEYNGYKAYWADGGQLIPPHDVGVIEEARKVTSLDQVKRLDLKAAKKKGRLKELGADMDRRYLKAISAASLDPKANKKNGDSVTIVYTPLHGVGGVLARRALESWGFKNVKEVASQIKPDPEFPTVESPNPEDPKAFDQAIELAKGARADIAVASDPDADRMGLVARDAKGELRFVTGNQMAALFTYYVCESLTAAGKMPDRPLVVTTNVTTDLMNHIAESYDVDIEETLTGFKWIGAVATREAERRAAGKSARDFLFGCEESYGYLFGDHCRDKDGIVSACMAAEIARWAKERDKTIPDVLDEIYRRYGVYDESQTSVYMRGETGMERIRAIMKQLREKPPKTIGGRKVVEVMDYYEQPFKDANGKTVKGPKQLPESNVLMFKLEGGAGRIFARPSGTEPKIKFYFNLCDRDGAPFKTAAEVKRRAKALAAFAKRAKKDFVDATGAKSDK